MFKLDNHCNTRGKIHFLIIVRVGAKICTGSANHLVCISVFTLGHDV